MDRNLSTVKSLEENTDISGGSLIKSLEKSGTSMESEGIGVRINQVLKDKKISLRELARRVGVGHSTLGGQIRNPSVFNPAELRAIAHALEVDYDWLLYGVASRVDENPTIREALEPATTAQTYFNRGKLYFSLGQNEAAIAQFLEAANRAELSGESLIEIAALTQAGRAALRLGELNRSLSLLNRARNLLNPTCPPDLVADNLLALASLEFRQGKFHEMQTHLAEARILLDLPTLAESPLQPRYWELLAARAQAYEQWQDALIAYQNMSMFNNLFEDLNNLSSQMNQGIVLAYLGRFDEAIAINQAVVDLADTANSPSHQRFKAWAYATLGLAYEFQGEWGKALTAYTESDAVIESAEAVLGMARCMNVFASPLFDLSLQRGVQLLSQESPTPYIDYTLEFLFLLEIDQSQAKELAKAWVNGMNRLVPMDYWQSRNRKNLLEMLKT